MGRERDEYPSCARTRCLRCLIEWIDAYEAMIPQDMIILLPASCTEVLDWVDVCGQLGHYQIQCSHCLGHFLPKVRYAEVMHNAAATTKHVLETMQTTTAVLRPRPLA